MLTIKQLRTPMTSKEVKALLTLYWTALKIPTSWLDGAIQKTLLTAISRLASDLTELSKIIVEFTLNDYARGDILAEYSDNNFDNQAIEAIATAGPLLLTSTASVPYVINPGQLIAATPAGIQFWNTTGGTLVAGGTLELQWLAVKKGAAANIGAPTILETALAGVSIGPNEGADPWYTTTGADPESDDQLQTRNRTKWATLAVSMVIDGYINLALKVPGITKVSVDATNPRGPFTVDVAVAANGALASTELKTAAQSAFAKRVLNTSSSWPADPASYVAIVDPATYVFNPSGTVYFDPGYLEETVRTALNQALNKFVANFPIGGREYSPGPANALLLSDVTAIIESVPGVRGSTITSGVSITLTKKTLVLASDWTNLVLVPTTTGGP